MKRPSFQFYPSDWLSDPNVIAMTAEERGAYIQLIALMWNTEDCSLRDDEVYLSKLSGVDNVVIRSLYPCFKVVNGTLRHKRLDVERLKQDEYRAACSTAGKKGMKARWKGRKTAKESTSDKVVITKDNSSTSSPTSTSSIKSSTYVEGETPKEFGNPEINKMLQALKAKLGIGAFADARLERNFGKNLVNLLAQLGKDEFVRRLDIISNDSFKRKNCNRIKYLYHELKGFIEPQDNSIKSF